MRSVYEASYALLTSGTLEAKLAFPTGELTDDVRAPVVDIEAPTRAPVIVMHEGSDRLPPLKPVEYGLFCRMDDASGAALKLLEVLQTALRIPGE